MTRPPLRAVLLAGVAAALVSCAGTPREAVPRPELSHLSAWNGSPEVTTRFGAVQGVKDDGGTYLWRAIPYAAPPVGDLRWRAPRDPAPWPGVRSPANFNAGCTQPGLFGGVHGSEDCLSLNVWRPRDDSTRLPVYVWIHGGGNSIGSATMVPDYYGTGVAGRSHMVFVSMNYRLGPFGWFTHPALRAGANADDASGNYGTLDIIQALRWVHDNIEAFGGDPGNVTVAGESAGAFDVLSLLISPRAAGLFHKAVAESGSANTRSMDEADARSQAALETLLVQAGKARTGAEAASLSATMDAPSIAAFLRSRTDRQILRCFPGGTFGMIDMPTLLRDGSVLPANGFEALSGPGANRVPLILGTNSEEVKLFIAFSSKLSWKSDLYAAVATYGSERWKASGVDEVARRLTTAGPAQPPVYAYLFSWGAPDETGASVLPGTWGRRLGAFHSLEIPFFLGTDTLDGVLQGLLFTKKNEPGRKALTAAMMDYAGQFARTGDPNRPGSGLPPWLPWTSDPGAAKLMQLDATNEAPVIGMSAMELTDEGVLAAVRSDLAEPLRSQTLAALDQTRTPAGVR